MDSPIQSGKPAGICSSAVSPASVTSDALHPGDRIKSLHAGRPGSVVKVYADGSAIVLWDDGTPQPEGMGHERMPRKLLVVVPSRLPAEVLKRLECMDPYEVAFFSESGAGYLNPLLGRTPAETCGEISNVLALLHKLLMPINGEVVDFCEVQSGIALMVLTAWSAAQYEGNRAGFASSEAVEAGGQS